MAFFHRLSTMSLFIICIHFSSCQMRQVLDQEGMPLEASEPPPALLPTTWDHLSMTALEDDGDKDSFLSALAQSRKWLGRQSSSRRLTIADRSFSAAELDRSLARVEELVHLYGFGEEFRKRLSALFDPYVTQGNEESPVLATGYYVPLIEGSFTPDASYPVPVYSVPNDLISISLGDFDESLKGRRFRGRIDGHRLVPYWERKEIRQGQVLDESAEPIAWVKDELELFFIEIQGSGIIRDQHGKQRVIGYAGQNGRAYRPIGRLLIDEGKIAREHMSLQAIKTYLRENPAELPRVLAYNPSFVFFQFTNSKVLGNLGRPLTPGRSIATDHRHVPPAALAFLSVERPKVQEDGTITSDGRLERFVFNQDTGGAIRGAARVDFFWGSGDQAELMAGAMQHRGRLLVLVPRPEATTIASGHE